MTAFWIGFLVGGIICGIIGFLGACLLAAAGKASRAEEEMKDSLIINEAREIINDVTKIERLRRGDYLPEKLKSGDSAL